MSYLLELAKRERDAYESVELHKRYAELYKERLRVIEEYGNDCESRDRDIETYKNLIDTERAFEVLAQIDLNDARRDIREYYAELNNR